MHLRWRIAFSLVALAILAAIGSAVLHRADARAAAATARAEPAQSQKIVLQFFKGPRKVPDFTIQTLDGRTLTSKDLRGKVTLVNFWATWCPPCRAEIPDLIALQNKYGSHLQIIGISEDVGAPDLVRRFVAEHGINYPVAMATPELQRAFPGVTGLPTSFILDRDAQIVQKHVGLLSATTTDYETRALAGLPIDAAIERIDPPQPVGLANAAQAKEIPGIDLTRLTSEKRVETLLRLNAEACTCGCELTVARCRIEDPACSVSLPLARRIAAEIAKKPDRR